MRMRIISDPKELESAWSRQYAILAGQFTRMLRRKRGVLVEIGCGMRQKRLIEADTDPRWTKTPPLEWFSPPRKLVLDYLKLVGFRKLRQVTLKSGLVIRSDAARALLKDWDVRQDYWRFHREALERDGLEIPDWLIISGVKGLR